MAKSLCTARVGFCVILGLGIAHLESMGSFATDAVTVPRYRLEVGRHARSFAGASMRR